MKIDLTEDQILWLKTHLENYVTEYYDHLQETTTATNIISKIIELRLRTRGNASN